MKTRIVVAAVAAGSDAFSDEDLSWNGSASHDGLNLEYLDGRWVITQAAVARFK